LGALVGTLAELYGCESARLGRAVRPSLVGGAAALPAGFQLGPPPPQPDLVGAARQIALDFSKAAGVHPERLPPVPLFSRLPKDAFAQVLASLKLVRLQPGGTVIRQGDGGQSFFVLARGSVSVTHLPEGADTPLELAKLHDGSIFGEMALVSAQPRSATVTALTDCDLLEFD